MEYIWSITGKCNLKCQYCWDPYKDLPQLSYKECCLLINELADSDCSMIIFTGGEPTIHKDFFKIVKYAHEKEIKNLKLCTNGFNLPQILERLLQSEINEIHISVNKAADIINRNDYDQYKKAIRKLKDAGKKVVFVSIIDILCLGDYISVLELAEKLEVTVMFQFMAKPEDKSVICLSDLEIEEKEVLFKDLEQIHSHFKKIIESFTFSYYDVAKKYYLHGVIPDVCYADEKYRIISPDGIITPCYWKHRKDGSLDRCFTDKCLVWFRYNKRLEQIYMMVKSGK